MLKIEDLDLAKATMYFSKSEDCSQLRDTLTECLSHPIRECCWYARILDLMRHHKSLSTLFVFGADHFQAMHNLIESTGMTVLIAQRDYLPEPSPE